MSDVRKDVALGTVDGKQIEHSVGILGFETLVIAIALGVWAHSWWIGGGVFLALMIMSVIKKTAVPLAFLLTLCWGVVGWAIGAYLIGSVGAGVVIAIVALLIGGGTHSYALQYTLAKK